MRGGDFPGSSGTQTTFALEFAELLDGMEIDIGSLRVTARSVLHLSGAPAYALRVVCGEKVIAYSGDTEWTEPPAEF
jgi:ribonuclease BN (tRNA processing enzyme)